MVDKELGLSPPNTGDVGEEDEDDIEDEVDVDTPFTDRNYGVFLDDEVRLVMDERCFGGRTTYIVGRYLSMADDRIAIMAEDGKIHWVSLIYIVDIVCLFHRKPLPEKTKKEKEGEKDHSHNMFG